MKITYLHHSGFSVETETKVLLFDYYTEGGRKAYFDPAAYPDKAVFVFVSHAHEDHYDRRILSWAKLPNVRYVLPLMCGQKQALKAAFFAPSRIGHTILTAFPSKRSGPMMRAWRFWSRRMAKPSTTQAI